MLRPRCGGRRTIAWVFISSFFLCALRCCESAKDLQASALPETLSKGYSRLQRIFFEKEDASGSDTKCQPWAIPAAHQCHYVQSHGNLCGDAGVRLYLEARYCTLAKLGALSNLLMGLWIVCLLATLTVCAERFFCPALEVISDFLKLPPNVAGATLLSFGNGAPDVFTQLAAMQSVDASAVPLALGEPLGGGLFVSNVVLAIVILASPTGTVKVMKSAFLRDAGFYLGAVLLLLLFVYDGKFVLYEGLTMIAYYACFVGYILFNETKAAPPLHIEESEHYKEFHRHIQHLDRVERRSTVAACNASSDWTPRSVTSEGRESIGVLGPRTHSAPASESGRRSIDVHSMGGSCPELDSSDRDYSRTPPVPRSPRTLPPLDEFLSFHSDPRIFLPEALPPGDAHLPVADLSDDAFHHAVTFGAAGQVPVSAHATPFSDSQPPHSLPNGHGTSPYAGPATSTHFTPARARFAPENEATEPLLPERASSDASGPSETSVSEMLMLPLVWLLRLTMPEVGMNDDVSYPKVFAVLLPITAPLFVALVCGLAFQRGDSLDANALAYGAACSLFSSVIIYAIYPRDGRHYGILSSFFTAMTFAVSILWMYTLSTELVRVCKALGYIFGVSQAMLGVTVLAWSNSIGDGVANFAMARDGFPDMAVAACFASPLFTLVGGLGMSMTMAILAQGPLTFEVAVPLRIGLTFALGSIMRYLIMVPLVHKFELSKSVALVSIAIYAVFNTVYLLVTVR